MEIPKTAGPAGVKTEWKANVNEKEQKAEVKVESFGAQLNRIAGAAVQEKGSDKKGELSKEAYLKMLMEQIKFQDPFNPVKNEQFSQQMTALSQLEQQVNTNKNLERLVQQQSNQQIAALQLVGKNITADRGAIYHDKDKPSTLSFKLPEDAAELSVDILNAAGEKINTVPIGPRQQGDISTKWDGSTAQNGIAEGGKYAFKVNAKGLDGKEIIINTKTDGRVTGITNSQGVTYLLVGDQRVGLNDIEVIKEGTPEGSTAASASTIPAQTGNLSGTNPEANKGSSQKADDKPSVAISNEAAKSLAEAPSKLGELNPLMQMYMR